MANTKKTTTSTTTATEAKITAPIVDTEKETLKQQLAEQQTQFEQLKAQMEVMMKAMATSATIEKNAAPTTRKDRNIPFINLTTGKVVLKGSTYWEIEGQFTKRNFLEREARLIINNTPNLISSGGVYIADAQFVEENDLSEVYQNLLTDAQMKDLLNHEANYVVEAYKSASDGQKKIIVDLITNKKLNGEEVDANILVKLGALCGRDLMNLEPLDETEG